MLREWCLLVFFAFGATQAYLEKCRCASDANICVLYCNQCPNCYSDNVKAKTFQSLLTIRDTSINSTQIVQAANSLIVYIQGIPVYRDPSHLEWCWPCVSDWGVRRCTIDCGDCPFCYSRSMCQRVYDCMLPFADFPHVSSLLSYCENVIINTASVRQPPPRLLLLMTMFVLQLNKKIYS